jgi:hypothetical protein
MRYLFLVYTGGSQGKELPAGESAAFDQACRENEAALRASGYLLAAISLQTDSTTRVRVLKSRLSLQDGFINRTSALLAALYFVEARDLNEAVRLASQMPQARRGPIEIRSIAESDSLPSESSPYRRGGS